MQLIISRVENYKDMLLFIKVPSLMTAYNSLNYNEPSDNLLNYNPAYNPVHKHLKNAYFIAARNDKPVGRIAAIIDTLNPKPNTGFFGCFECENDPEAAFALLSAAREFLESYNCKKMIGPATFNTNQQVGILIEGFKSGPQAMLPYNPPYYGELIEKAGLVKKTDLLTFSLKNTITIPPIITRVCHRAKKNNVVSIKPLPLFNTFQTASLIKKIFNESMSENWGFIPFTMDEAISFTNLCQQYADPDLILCIWVDRTPAGILICLPTNLNSRDNSIRVAILGITPQYRLRGLDACLLERTLIIMQEKGYTKIDISMIHEDNTKMIKTINQFTGTILNRRYRVYVDLNVKKTNMCNIMEK